MKPLHRSTRYPLACSVATLLAASLLASSSQAAPIMWSGATNVWSLNTNWAGNVLPVSNDSLVFDIAGAGGLSLNNDLTSTSFNIAGITFNSGAGPYVIGGSTPATANTGNAFVLTGSVINNSAALQTINDPFGMTAAQTFNTNTGAINLGGVISGAGGIIKTGTGTLRLNTANPNTFTGNVVVNQGILQLGLTPGAAGTLTTTALGAANAAVTKVTVASGATIDINGNPVNAGMTISGSGTTGQGALINSAGNQSTNQIGSPNITLAANATIGGTGNIALINSGFAADTLDLAGFTLTKAGTNTLYLSNTTVTAGTINVTGGTLSQSNGNSSTSNASAAALSLANTNGISLNLNNLALSLGSLTGGGAAGGNVVLGTATLTVGALNTSPAAYAGIISGTGGITKTGSGTLTLSGANTYAGATTVNNGTLLLTGSLSSSSALAVGGSTFTLSKAGTNTQTVAGLAVNPGGSTINNTVSTDTLALGSITRSAGNGTVNFGTTTGAITTTSTNVNSIIGPWASIGIGTGLQYAVANGGASAITGLTGTAGTAGTLGNVTDNTANYEFAAAATTAANLTGNTLRYGGTNTGAGANVVFAIGAANTLTFNGLMNADSSPSSGTNTLTISGGPSTGGLLMGSTNELVITANAQATTISAVIGDGIGGAGALTYSGTGTLTLANTVNTYTGKTYLNSGVTNIVADRSLGAVPGSVVADQLTFGGGTLQFGVASISLAANRGVTLLSAGGTIDTSLNSGAVTGIIAGSGALTKTGANTLTLSASSAYSGGTTVSGGTLALTGGGNFNGSNEPVGTGALTITNATVTTSGGSFRIEGQTGNTNNRTVNVTNGTLNLSNSEYLKTLNLAGSTVNATVAGGDYLRAPVAGFFINATGADSTITGKVDLTNSSGIVDVAAGTKLTISGPISENNGGNGAGKTLTKNNAGTLALAGTNTYTGPTTVNGGTLLVSGSINATTSVGVSGGTLQLGASNVINNAAGVTLGTSGVAGGTFKTGGFSEYAGTGNGTGAGLGALSLSENSTLDFGAGTSTLWFSSIGTFGAGKILTIDNWSGNPSVGGGTDQFRFTSDPSAALGQISFTGLGGASEVFVSNGGNPYYEIVPVPEPSTTGLLSAGMLIGLVGFRERRRLLTLCRRADSVRAVPGLPQRADRLQAPL